MNGSLWRAPLLLGLISLIGLLSALFFDGLGDAVSWIALTIPPAVVLWFLYVTPRKGKILRQGTDSASSTRTG